MAARLTDCGRHAWGLYHYGPWATPGWRAGAWDAGEGLSDSEDSDWAPRPSEAGGSETLALIRVPEPSPGGTRIGLRGWCDAR